MRYALLSGIMLVAAKVLAKRQPSQGSAAVFSGVLIVALMIVGTIATVIWYANYVIWEW